MENEKREQSGCLASHIETDGGLITGRFSIHSLISRSDMFKTDDSSTGGGVKRTAVGQTMSVGAVAVIGEKI